VGRFPATTLALNNKWAQNPQTCNGVSLAVATNVASPQGEKIAEFFRSDRLIFDKSQWDKNGQPNRLACPSLRVSPKIDGITVFR
jgi:hypothetical protein